MTHTRHGDDIRGPYAGGNDEDVKADVAVRLSLEGNDSHSGFPHREPNPESKFDHELNIGLMSISDGLDEIREAKHMHRKDRDNDFKEERLERLQRQANLAGEESNEHDRSFIDCGWDRLLVGSDEMRLGRRVGGALTGSEDASDDSQFHHKIGGSAEFSDLRTRQTAVGAELGSADLRLRRAAGGFDAASGDV